MFSTRTPEDFAENSISLRVREMRGAGVRLLDLTESNPTRVGFLAPPELLGLLANPAGAEWSNAPTASWPKDFLQRVKRILRHPKPALLPAS